MRRRGQEGGPGYWGDVALVRKGDLKGAVVGEVAGVLGGW